MLRRGRAALDDFATAIKLSPHSAHIYFNRANLFLSLKMLTEAEQDYTTGLYKLLNNMYSQIDWKPLCSSAAFEWLLDSHCIL